jgi:hypothetical protein
MVEAGLEAAILDTVAEEPEEDIARANEAEVGERREDIG